MNSIIWFRNDLRLADNPALEAAMKLGGAVTPVFIHDPEADAPWQPGAASNWWLHHSLEVLRQRLQAAGSRLVLKQGPATAALTEIARQTKSGAVFFNKRHEPAALAHDGKTVAALQRDGLRVEGFIGNLLRDPAAIRNQTGGPFQVFTAYWNHCLRLETPSRPTPAPDTLPAPKSWPASLALGDLNLLPKIKWDGGLAKAWTPGETGARAALDAFVAERMGGYAGGRDLLGQPGTSQLSPRLHFGEISARQVWHAAKKMDAKFLAELGWREFSHHLLVHFPHTTDAPLRPQFKDFPWRRDAQLLKSWQRGLTGFPVVDAGLRELWATGFMHNRARMITASFLVKDLRLSWLEGARWFWDTLVDADLAQNTMGWQWTAGCGADAAPYFRIFNPFLQGAKFDAEGDYVRRWCPELAGLPAKWIHQPVLAPPLILKAAGVNLGVNYPEPIVNHALAREEALAAFAALKS